MSLPFLAQPGPDPLLVPPSEEIDLAAPVSSLTGWSPGPPFYEPAEQAPELR